MDPSPYESPKYHETTRRRWRVIWKRACIASLCFAGILFLAAKTLVIVADGSNETAWFLVVDGLIALGELVAITLAGICGIGWALSRRPLSENQ